jgi:hypothetical protein
MLAAVGFSQRVHTDEGAVEAYHAEIADAVSGFPVDFGVWTGYEVDLPPSATKLLRPNAIVARDYRTDTRGGIVATLMVVQCADIRDMQGHYPPNCYPAHGWARAGFDPDARLGELPAARYGFVQTQGGQERGITVYNLFVMPTGAVTTSMDAVRKAGSDYLLRPYGAAQIQVVIGSEVADEHHGWILEQMRAIAAPVLEKLLSGAPAHREGGER